VFHPARERNKVGKPASIATLRKCAKENGFRVAHLTTTGIKCGIGQYTKRIIEEYSRNEIANLILNCECAVNSVDTMPAGVPSTQAWYFDNLHWTGSHIKSGVFDVLKDWGATHVIIQQHWAFYSPEILLDFVKVCVASGLRVTVVCHNYIPRWMLAFKAFNWLRVPIFSHRETEVDAARKDGVSLQFTPHGVDKYDPLFQRSIVGRDWRNHPPVIVTNGFLRRHKGLSRLIGAMPAVIKAYPGARLVVQSPVYPSEDSREELDSCLKAIRDLQLQDHVAMHTDFLEKAGVLQEIAKADLAVFPYDLSDEGGSGSATDALSVGLPVVVSQAEIFDGIRDVAITSIADSQHLADAIIALLCAPEKYEKHAHAAVAYARENGWDNVAWRFLSHQ
jgi:glycosyltransferase involved in cell wall biosynthesis